MVHLGQKEQKAENAGITQRNQRICLGVTESLELSSQASEELCVESSPKQQTEHLSARYQCG